MSPIGKLVVTTLLFSFAGASLSLAQSAPLTAKPPTLKFSDPLPANLFSELAKAINPAVVNISTSILPRNMRRDPFWDQLQEFYGFQLGPQAPRGQSKPQQMALGTGFLIREDGLIVTNAHVVKMADLVSVQFEEGGKSYDAKIIGSDERSDIALLKFKPDASQKLVIASLGSSADVEVGEWVAAFGNPFGHGHSVSKGIISSKGRSLEEINRFPLLQTDAAINPGNSGGPLVNSKGVVIGVNSAIDARAQGIGFAIPIDEVKRIIPELEHRGRLRKGYLGIGLSDVVSYEEQEVVGTAVTTIERGGPAEQAGVKYGDTITEFNGKKLKNSVELIDAVSGTPPGTKAKIKVVRQQGSKEKIIELAVTIGERPEEGGRRSKTLSKREAPPKSEKSNLGLTISDMNEDLRQSLGLPSDVKKPVVTDVEEGSVASFVGLREGDVILEINRNEVSTAKEALAQLKKDGNTIKVARGNRVIIVSVR